MSNEMSTRIDAMTRTLRKLRIENRLLRGLLRRQTGMHNKTIDLIVQAAINGGADDVRKDTTAMP